METALWEGERESGQTSWSDRQIWTRITALASRYDISEVQSCKTGLIGGWGTPRDLSWLFEGYKLPAPQMSSFPLKNVVIITVYRYLIGKISQTRRGQCTYWNVSHNCVSKCIRLHLTAYSFEKISGETSIPPPLPGSSWPSATRDFSPSGLLPPNDKS